MEAINNGSIFSIVTARGHTPEVMKESVYNMIISNHMGIDSNELLKNLEKYRDIEGLGSNSKKEMIREYLDMCRFYPVTYGEGSATSPEEGKIQALNDFVGYDNPSLETLKKRREILLKSIKLELQDQFPRIGNDPFEISSHHQDRRIKVLTLNRFISDQLVKGGIREK